ncbi:MAG: transcriptional repressor [Desulfovibrio sp.]|jgi:Fur family ferric uptake transcriptional regulator|nr:transcriptional repressor [Desulfovibrio sp.]
MEEQTKYRLSKQRKVILEELRKVNTHPTADEVYDMVRKIMPRISLGTVYRNLEFLCTQGLARKVGPAGAQKRFDGNATPHAHIRCKVCHRVADVPVHLEAPMLGPEDCMGFDIEECNIEFEGICPECQGKTC